jgi:hypothetical protein
MWKLISGMVLIAMTLFVACKKDSERKLNPQWRYFEVGFKDPMDDWRDTAFVVATSDTTLLNQIQTELGKPVNARKIVFGVLVRGSGDYNKNGTHTFKWHFKEDDWELTDVTAEIYSGRPYSDVDLDLDYWLGIERFGPWNSYIRREITK